MKNPLTKLLFIISSFSILTAQPVYAANPDITGSWLGNYSQSGSCGDRTGNAFASVTNFDGNGFTFLVELFDADDQGSDTFIDTNAGFITTDNLEMYFNDGWVIWYETATLRVNNQAIEFNFEGTEGGDNPVCNFTGTLRLSRDTSDTSYQVQNTSGNPLYATSGAIQSIIDSVPSASSLITQNNDSIILDTGNGTKITVTSNSIVSVHPPEVAYTQEHQQATLLRGSIGIVVPETVDSYNLTTPVASISVNHSSDNRKRNTGSTNYTATYNQAGFDGTLTVSVQTGSVTVIDRNGNSTQVTASEEKSINDVVKRSHWVTPVDGGYLYGAQNNVLSWLVYPGATGYAIEINVPIPIFSENNPKTFEYIKQTIYLTKEQLHTYGDLVIWNIHLPAANSEILFEARIFALGSDNNVISDSISSDKVIFIYK